MQGATKPTHQEKHHTNPKEERKKERKKGDFMTF
jgi:hypothetical protein